MNLEVKHDTKEHEVVINGMWCDIGSHSVPEDRIISKYDVSVCEDCFEHYNEAWI